MKKVLIIFVLTLLISLVVFCEEGRLVWTVSDNYTDFFERADNVEKKVYSERSFSIGIKKKSYGIQKDTELYLPFDNTNAIDSTGRYRVSYSNFFLSDNKQIMNKAAYFINGDNRIELVGKNKTFFQPGVNLTSFSVSYWIYPVTTAYNEEILKIGGQYYNKKKENIEDQSIINRLEDGRLIWEFNNIFTLGEEYLEKLSLKSYVRIMPDKWTQITMTFDSFTGIVRVYINGIESSIAIATVDGTLNSSVYNLRYHATNRCLIKIAQSFTGAMDEFYIFNKLNNYYDDRYDANGGEAISKVLLLDNNGGYIQNISTTEICQNNSEIRYFYRYANEPFPYDYGDSELQWHLVEAKSIVAGAIKYIQFKIVFLPGTNNETTPLFRGITVDYNKNIPPSRPVGVKIEPMDEKIKIKWKKNSEIDIKGYKLYYGTKSGYYFGDAKNSHSPMIIKNDDDFEINGVEIDNLNNNTIYYFAVTAFDDSDGNNESEFSQEVFCRPMSNAYRYVLSE